MTHPGVDLVPVTDATLADGDALADVEALLAANDLPAADVDAKPAAFFVAFDDGDAVGIGGVETHGSVGLLRSLVVREAVRGQGYGTAICDALEREAREDGLEALYLLTTTASEFFAARGYDEMDRADAPDAIRETAEFAELCSDAATCMHTSL